MDTIDTVSSTTDSTPGNTGTTESPTSTSTVTTSKTQKTSTQTILYTFNVAEVFEESGSSSSSASQYFWLNSGAKLIIKNGIGSTIIGELPKNDPWRRVYAQTNPLDTENGAFPQNLFRLVTQTAWENVEQELDFSIQEIHAINTHDRDAFSGIFLMSRYINSNTLYYAGIRMDGKAVIKKKLHGVYYTLAETQLFSSTISYDRISFPNLIPTNTWFRIASNTITTPQGAVQISLSFAHSQSEPLETVLTTTDTGVNWPPITARGHVGIRTDYADVLFDNYTISTSVLAP